MYSLELLKIYFPLVFNMQKKKKRLLIKLSPCMIPGIDTQNKVFSGSKTGRGVQTKNLFPLCEE